jgi:hypothetical protein
MRLTNAVTSGLPITSSFTTSSNANTSLDLSFSAVDTPARVMDAKQGDVIIEQEGEEKEEEEEEKVREGSVSTGERLYRDSLVYKEVKHYIFMLFLFLTYLYLAFKSIGT